MRRRIFFAINLEKRSLNAVRNIMTDVRGSFGSELLHDICFMPESNWHVTIAFLGDQNDADLPAIIAAGEACTANFEVPEISFDRVVYGPPGRAPRMIWLHAQDAASAQLGDIRSALEEELAARQVPFAVEHRPFSGHITLARFADTFHPADLPTLGGRDHVHILPGGIDLMESEMKPAGAEYSILQHFPFLG